MALNETEPPPALRGDSGRRTRPANWRERVVLARRDPRRWRIAGRGNSKLRRSEPTTTSTAPPRVRGNGWESDDQGPGESRQV